MGSLALFISLRNHELQIKGGNFLDKLPENLATDDLV